MHFKVVEEENAYDEDYPLEQFEILITDYLMPTPVLITFFNGRSRNLMMPGTGCLMNVRNPTNFNTKIVHSLPLDFRNILASIPMKDRIPISYACLDLGSECIL